MKLLKANRIVSTFGKFTMWNSFEHLVLISRACGGGEIEIERKRERQRQRQTDRQTGRQTDKQIDKHRQRQILLSINL